MNRKRLYSQLLLIFILLILPIQCIGIYIINYSNNMLQSSIRDLTDNNMAYIMSSLNAKLGSVSAQLDNMLWGENYSLREFSLHTNQSTEESYVYWLSIKGILDDLSLFKRRESSIDDVYVYYPNEQARISTRWGMYDPDPEETEQVFAAYIASPSPYFLHNGKLTVCRALFNVEDKANVFLCATLTNDAVCKLLKSGVFNMYPVAIVSGDGQIISSRTDLRYTEESVVLDGELYHALVQGSKTDPFYMVRYLPDAVLNGTLQRTERMLAVFIIASIPLFALYTLLIQRLVKNPVNQLIAGYRRVENGELSFSIPRTGGTLEFQELTEGSNKMVADWSKTIDTVYKQQIYMQGMELKHLQSQINPHFLYNTFFLLSHMMKDGDSENAIAVLDDLGKYFQYITRTGKNTVSLQDEYDYACIYLDIQKRRFEDRLSVDLSPLPEGTSGMQVPKLILQPLLENVFTHARNTCDGVIQVHLEAEQTDAALRLTVWDNGTGVTEETLYALRRALDNSGGSEETTALTNISRRLFLTGIGRMELAITPLHGLSVTLEFNAGERGTAHAPSADTAS